MKNLHKAGALIASLDSKSIKKDIDPSVSIIAGTENRDANPVYVEAFAKVKSRFETALEKEDLRIPSDVMEAAVEGFLETAFIDRDVADSLSLKSLVASTTSVNNPPEVTGVENFDDSYASELGITNAGNMIISYASRIRAEVDKFFPTIKVGNKVGLTIESERVAITQGLNHRDGKPVSFDRLGMLDILDTRRELGTVRIYPNVEKAIAEIFVPTATVAPWKVTDSEGDTVQTAPVLFSKTFDYKGASHTNKQLEIHALFTAQDELQPGSRVDMVFLDFEGEVIPFNFANRASAFADETAQGSKNDYLWNVSEQFVLTADTKTLANAPITKITIPAGNRAVVEIQMSGLINIRTSNTVLNLNKVRLVRLVDSTNNVVEDQAVLDGIQTELDKVSLETSGYVLDVTLQNANLRTEGWMIDSELVTENVYVQPQRPISHKIPVNRTARASTIATMQDGLQLNYAREAVNKLIETEEMLRQESDNGTLPADVGITSTSPSSYYINNSFIPVELDLAAELNSRRHGEREEDLAGLQASVANDAVRTMAVDSRIDIAINGLKAKYSRELTWVIIGHPREIARLKKHRNLLDSEYKWDFASVPSNRLGDKIYIVPRMDAKEFHPFNFGNTIEAKTHVLGSVVSNSGQTYRTLIIQPQNYKHVFNKVMCVIKMTNRSEALRKICC